MAGLSGGGGGGASGVRAGRAYVEMFLKADGVGRALDRVQDRFKKFSGITLKAGAVVGGLGAGITAAFKPAMDALGEQAKIADLAELFGISGEKASRLFGIMAAGGSDLRDAQEGLATFGQRVNDALSGKGEEAQELFKELGVGAEEFAGLDTADQFYKLLDAIKASNSPLGHLGLLMKAVGEDTGKNLSSVLQLNADQMRELGDAFETSTGDLNAAREAARQQTLAMASLKKVWAEVATAVAPVVKEMAERFTENLKPVMAFVRGNRELFATALKVGGALAVAGAAIVALAPAIGGVAGAVAGLVALGGSAFGAVVATVKLLAAAVGALLSPVGLVTAAVAGLGYLWVTQTDSGAAAFEAVKGAAGSLVEYLKGAFGTVAAVGAEAWGGIVAAVQKGDLQLAAEIGLTALQLLWAKALGEMTDKWNGFKNYFLNGWTEVTAGTGTILREMWNVAAEVFDGIWSKVSAVFKAIAETVQGVVARIQSVWSGLSDSMKTVVGVLATIFAPMLAPVMLLVGLIEKAWAGMTNNIAENLNTFVAWVERAYVDVKAAIVNTFNAIARGVLDSVITAARGLEAITPGDKWKNIREGLEATRGGLKDVDAEAEKRRINEARDRLNEELKKKREEVEKAREEARAADAAAASSRAAEIEKKLKELTAEAKATAEAKLDYGGGGDFGEDYGGGGDFGEEAKAATESASKTAGSRGSFTAVMAGQRFGGVTKEVTELKGINRGVKDLGRDVRDVGKKLEFK